MMHRVAVTGYGVYTPFGPGVPAMMQALDKGLSAVRCMNEWPALEGLKSRIGAPAPDPDTGAIPRRHRRSMSRMSFFAVEAAREALLNSDLDPETLRGNGTGCVFGSTTGSPFAMNEAFEKLIKDKDISTLTSMVFFKGMSHTAASNLASYFGLTGPVIATSAACASALQAICLGCQLIASGRSRMLLCGGAEELHPTVTASFDILEATSIRFQETPSRTPRPFDRDRDGLVCGEGAGVLLLENLEHARSRGAPVYAEIEGFALNTSNVQITQSDPESQAACMRAALEDASIPETEIDYVNAHATGTIVGDRSEAESIAEIFGDRVPVSSLKGYLGHTLGACGAVESAVCLEMMRNNVVFPGLNLDNVAADCSIINLIQEKKDHPVRRVLKNAFAFGGINVSIVFRRPTA